MVSSAPALLRSSGCGKVLVLTSAWYGVVVPVLQSRGTPGTSRPAFRPVPGSFVPSPFARRSALSEPRLLQTRAGMCWLVVRRLRRNGGIWAFPGWLFRRVSGSKIAAQSSHLSFRFVWRVVLAGGAGGQDHLQLVDEALHVVQGPLDILRCHLVLVEVLVENGCYSERAVDVAVVVLDPQAAGNMVELTLVSVVPAV